ncbi:MAG: uroporphyrinogen-III synthase [Dysosmobacter welbionis]
MAWTSSSARPGGRARLRRLAACRFAVISASTGRRLANHGIQADLCPATYTSAGLAEALKGQLEPGMGWCCPLPAGNGCCPAAGRWGYEVRELSVFFAGRAHLG